MTALSIRLVGTACVLLAATLAASAQERQKAYLRVYLPTPDTRLEIQGVAIDPSGKAERLFESPPLEPGRSFAYDIKATWTEAGKEMTRERSVKVLAGQTTEVDLRLEVDNSPSVVPPPTKPPVTLDPAEKPMDKPVDKPMDKPADKPIDKPEEVPNDPSFTAPPAEVVDKMLELAGVRETDVVYDLRTGDGAIAAAAVKPAGDRKAARKAVGFESNPTRLAQARSRIAALGDKVEIRDKDFTTLTAEDLSEATVVTLGTVTLDQLRTLAPMLKKLKVGTRVVVHELEIPGLRFDDKRDLTTPDKLDHVIYLYKIK